MPTIEHCFAVYMATQLIDDLDPVAEELLRRAFFCGFESCIRAFDTLAEISHEDEDEGERAWQRLQAEFEKFATEQDGGEESINH